MRGNVAIVLRLKSRLVTGLLSSGMSWICWLMSPQCTLSTPINNWPPLSYIIHHSKLYYTLKRLVSIIRCSLTTHLFRFNHHTRIIGFSMILIVDFQLNIQVGSKHTEAFLYYIIVIVTVIFWDITFTRYQKRNTTVWVTSSNNRVGLTINEVHGTKLTD